MTDYTPLFQRALEAEYGLAVKTNNPKAMQILLCNWITAHPEFNQLMVCLPDVDGETWLVQKSVELPE